MQRRRSPRGRHGRRADGQLSVGEWFGRRTWRAAELDPELLADRKAALGVTVSVVVPTLDEGDTVAGVIGAAASLAGTLVDELVVIDGGSTDGTAAAAAAAGARVHQDRAVFPELGPPLGKGDALWRSLAVTSGDLVVFVDADVRNPDPRFVYGVLAPLLLDPQVQLVKAFYERPLEVAGTLYDSGGGRVTELTARPLINRFWPELAGIVQPLAGEYAGRRSLLESLPFLTGYGVELGLLIDTLLTAGIDAIAQVDLGVRVHRNQELDALSRMAYGVAQAALWRLPAAGRATFAEMAPPRYQQFARGHDGQVQPAPSAVVAIVERPPLQGRRTGS